MCDQCDKREDTSICIWCFKDIGYGIFLCNDCFLEETEHRKPKGASDDDPLPFTAENGEDEV